MTSQAADQASQIDRDMKKLRESMKGITIRAAGFKKDHDNLARQVARFTVALIEAEALIATRRNRNTNSNGARTRSPYQFGSNDPGRPLVPHTTTVSTSSRSK